MTGRQRVYLAMLLLAATLITGAVVSTLVPYAFGCRDGDTPASGIVPRDVVDATLLVLGGLMGSACTLCFLLFAYYDDFFGAEAAKTAGYVAIRSDAEAPGLGKN